MKKSIVTIVLSLFLIIGINQSAEAQFGKKFKNAMKTKIGKKSGSVKKGKTKKASKTRFLEFNEITDHLNISGEYFGLKDPSAIGIKFVKEDGGKIVNKLHYFETKGEPKMKFNFKESFYSKHKIKWFFNWIDAGKCIEMAEIAPGVLAIFTSSRSANDYETMPGIDAKRTVVDVGAKNKADFETWDIETAQAKLDMLITTLNSAKVEKVKKKLMRYPFYKKYKGKIAFSKSASSLRSRASDKADHNESSMITKRELGNDLSYKPFFEQPLEISHPGAWFNVTYEMAGVTTDREKLRKSSTKFSKNIPQIDKYKSEFFFLFGKILNSTYSNTADYAYLELLRLTQDKLKKGQTYNLKVTIWAYKDGANIDPVSTGNIQLEYGDKTEKFLFDPEKGWVIKLEDYLDE